MRIGAIVQASVFDAVNGVTRRYTALHVTTSAPAGASAAAAAIGAAHEALTALFPAQQTSFDSLETATVGELTDDPTAVSTGLAWGAVVANSILAWRAGDGFNATPPTYVPSPLPGRYQLTPPLFKAPLFRQFTNMTPWAMTSATQFSTPPPPALTSARYARDYDEVMTYGSADSTARNAFDTETARFWQSDTPVAIWDRVADDLITGDPHLGITATARLLAQANVAMADAVIALWTAKNLYDTWRPITAIQAGDTDGNPRTTADPTWQPLLTTPSFQEYPAGHPGVSAAAAGVLADQFGNDTSFTAISATTPGVTRTFSSFRAGVRQVIDARVFGGIHFRFAGKAAVAVGAQIAQWTVETQMTPRCGDRDTRRES
jgi:hypothetical protein